MSGMSIKHYKELVIWQLADELRREVYRLTDDGPILFARFLDYAFASAGETADWLDDGVARRHWSEADLEKARKLLRRLNPGLTKLMRYLRSSTARDRSKRGRLDSRTTRNPTNPT
jgi:hypothetical protein